jgi:hypothetical protein
MEKQCPLLSRTLLGTFLLHGRRSFRLRVSDRAEVILASPRGCCCCYRGFEERLPFRVFASGAMSTASVGPVRDLFYHHYFPNIQTSSTFVCIQHLLAFWSTSRFHCHSISGRHSLTGAIHDWRPARHCSLNSSSRNITAKQQHTTVRS